MSMLGTLGKIAMGIMVAKGVGSAMSGSKSSSGGGLGGLLGSLASGASSQQGGGALGSLIGSLTGGSNSSQGGAGGLGDLLGSLTGASQGSNTQGGGLGSLLNSLAGGSQNNSNTSASTANNSGNLGDLLSSAFAGQEVKATPDQEKQAEIILKAMISAAKADGHIDAKEQQKITEHIGEVTQEEIEFVRKEMQSPLDIQGLIASIPPGMEQQVYMMSLLAIDLDSKSEAEYMDKLAKGLNITPEVANNIHKQLGVPVLYS